MDIFKITITSWTSSFRYPNLISGFQPTLEVPPISTVLGLINAASGKYNTFQNVSIGYYFEYQAKQVDLETFYQISSGSGGQPSNNAKSNIMKREFLFDNKLILYLENKEIVDDFYNPKFQLLLGRMNDLATVDKIEKISLKKVEKLEKIKGQIIPLHNNYLPGKIQVLTKYYSNTFPRRNLGSEPYSIINCKTKDFMTEVNGYRDIIDGKEIDIYFHNIDINDE